MGISSKIKRTLEKKLSGKQELNKEVLRWKKSLEEVNRRMNSGEKKESCRFPAGTELESSRTGAGCR